MCCLFLNSNICVHKNVYVWLDIVDRRVSFNNEYLSNGYGLVFDPRTTVVFFDLTFTRIDEWNKKCRCKNDKKKKKYIVMTQYAYNSGS